MVQCCSDWIPMSNWCCSSFDFVCSSVPCGPGRDCSDCSIDHFQIARFDRIGLIAHSARSGPMGYSIDRTDRRLNRLQNSTALAALPLQPAESRPHLESVSKRSFSSSNSEREMH